MVYCNYIKTKTSQEEKIETNFMECKWNQSLYYKRL